MGAENRPRPVNTLFVYGRHDLQDCHAPSHACHATRYAPVRHPYHISNRVGDDGRDGNRSRHLQARHREQRCYPATGARLRTLPSSAQSPRHTQPRRTRTHKCSSENTNTTSRTARRVAHWPPLDRGATTSHQHAPHVQAANAGTGHAASTRICGQGTLPTACSGLACTSHVHEV